MKNNVQCKTITREVLVAALKPFHEYEVSRLQLNAILPDCYTVTGVDDKIVIYTKKGERPTFIYEQTDTPPKDTEIFTDEQAFLKALIDHIENERFNHFDLTVPVSTRDTLLDFALALKDDFIGEFTESANCKSISSVMGRDYDDYIPPHDGGYEITEQYLHSLQDSSFHFTKNQTAWGSREADEIAAKYRSEHEIPEDHDIDYDSSEWQEWEDAWCEDFRCQLTVKVTVLSDNATEICVEVFVTYGYGIDEVLVDKLIPLAELTNTTDSTEYSMDDHVRLLKIEVDEYEKPIVYFNMAFDGEVALVEDEYPSVQACLESVNYSQGTGFYPFQFIKMGDTIVHPPMALGKTVKQVSELFKELSEGYHEEEHMSADYFLNRIEVL